MPKQDEFGEGASPIPEEAGEVSPELEIYNQEPQPEDPEINEFNGHEDEEPKVMMEGGGMFEHTSVPENNERHGSQNADSSEAASPEVTQPPKTEEDSDEMQIEIEPLGGNISEDAPVEPESTQEPEEHNSPEDVPVENQVEKSSEESIEPEATEL